MKGIGIGVPGIVDPALGQSHASSVFGERDMPIAPLLEKRMGMPVKIEKPAQPGGARPKAGSATPSATARSPW